MATVVYESRAVKRPPPEPKPAPKPKRRPRPRKHVETRLEKARADWAEKELAFIAGELLVRAEVVKHWEDFFVADDEFVRNSSMTVAEQDEFIARRYELKKKLLSISRKRLKSLSRSAVLDPVNGHANGAS